MKQPVWILNSSLLVLFFISQLLLFTMQSVVPRRASISPDAVVVAPEKTTTPVDITTIYEQDLFGTYEVPVLPTQSYVEEVITPIPTPPKIIIPDIPVEKVPTFFAPLDVVLKGVIFVKDDPGSCIAIVQLKKTREERNYQVGDLMEDAQILKILSNRIIIIRSNGQQETLYLREEDASSDFNTEIKVTPKSIVEAVSDGKYTVNVDEFLKRVHNLGQFITLLDLTTVYKQGKSFGCRIGKIEKDSLGDLLGFMVDDIIVKIDDFYVDDLAHRITLYDHIIQKHVGDVIEVVMYRGQKTMTLSYGLVDNVSKNVVFTRQETHKKLLEELAKHEAKKDTVQSSENVVIQSIDSGADQEIIDQQAMNNDILQLDFDEDLSHKDKNYAHAPLHKSISDQIEEAQAPAGSIYAHEFDKHQKRLLQDRDKLTATLKDIKSKDKNNMMRRSSRNIIRSGMQQ